MDCFSLTHDFRNKKCPQVNFPSYLLQVLPWQGMDVQFLLCFYDCCDKYSETKNSLCIGQSHFESCGNYFY